MKKPYDPKLREAALEFKALCAKYDCAGMVLFISPTHCEFVNEISPSWSVMKFEGEGKIRFKSKKEDFPSREAQNFATSSTAHALTSIVEWSRKTFTDFSLVLFYVQQHMTILHSTWGEPDSVPGDGQ